MTILTENARAPSAWQGFCDASDQALGLSQIRAFGVSGLKHQRHFGSATVISLREVARISALISDLDRHVRILDRDIATEEERACVFNPSDAAYPVLARTLTARRNNLKETIAALESHIPLDGFVLRRSGCARHV